GRLLHAGNAAKKRRLAVAVAGNEADPVTLADHEVELVEEHIGGNGADGGEADGAHFLISGPGEAKARRARRGGRTRVERDVVRTSGSALQRKLQGLHRATRAMEIGTAEQDEHGASFSARAGRLQATTSSQEEHQRQ